MVLGGRHDRGSDGPGRKDPRLRHVRGLPNWSYLKNHASFRAEYANSYLGWMAYVAGKRESRRLIGGFCPPGAGSARFRDLSGRLRVSTSWYIDNHEPDPENSKYFKEPFLSRGCLRPLDFYPIPYRCFYAKDLTTCSWPAATSRSATSRLARPA